MKYPPALALALLLSLSSCSSGSDLGVPLPEVGAQVENLVFTAREGVFPGGSVQRIEGNSVLLMVSSDGWRVCWVDWREVALFSFIKKE